MYNLICEADNAEIVLVRGGFTRRAHKTWLAMKADRAVAAISGKPVWLVPHLGMSVLTTEIRLECN